MMPERPFRIGAFRESRPRVEFAHLLRGMAAGSVLLHHFFHMFWYRPRVVADLIVQPDLPSVVANPPSFTITDFGIPDFWGHFGVALFFLVSGFVIPFSVNSLSRLGFVIARVLRIWPTYMVGFTITLVCLAVNASRAGVAFPYRAWDVLSHYLILPRWPTLSHPMDGILWTLEIELFFYFVCLLFSHRLRRFDLSIFLLSLLSAPVAVIASLAAPVLLKWSFPVFALVHWGSSMMQFLCFLLVGTAYHYFFKGRINRSMLLMLHALLLSAFVLSWRQGLMSEQGWSGPISYLVAYVTFTVAFMCREGVSRLPQRRLFFGLADISYPLYVVHGVLGYSILAHAIKAGVGPGWALLLALAASFSLAIILHVLVERPSRELGRSLAKRYA
jgi:peptidoglycan/LPS O-acetylase OafA/YrhL